MVFRKQKIEIVGLSTDFILKGQRLLGPDAYRLLEVIAALKKLGKPLNRANLLRYCGFGGVRLSKAKVAAKQAGVLQAKEMRDDNGQFIAFDYKIIGGAIK